MPLPENVNDRNFQRFKDSVSVPGQPGVVVLNPDGTSLASGGGTSMLDDAAFTPGGSSLTPAGFLGDDTAPDPIDEGDIGAARMRVATRVQYVEPVDQSGDSMGDDANNALRVNVVAGAAGGTEYTEDTAAPANPQGGQLMARRRDTLAAETDLDGDHVALNATNKGELYVKQTDPVPVTDNGGSLTVDAVDLDIRNLTTGQDKVDARVRNAADSAFVEPATDRATAAAPFSTRLSDGAAFYDATKTGQLPTALVGGRLDVNVGAALPAGANNIGDVDVLTMPTGAGAAQVQGTTAHDVAAAQNPVPVAAVAETPDDTAPANQVSAEGDVVRIAADRDGAIYTHPHPPRIWHVSTEYTTQQTDATVKAAPGAGLSLYITDIYLAVNAAVTVTLEEGTTTLKWKYYASGQGDGASVNFTTPIKITANTLISVTTSAAVTLTLVVTGYTAP